MDTRQINGYASAARSMSLPKQPHYNSKPVQEALRHLASINLRELCNEAKAEHCRATRNLALCGRSVRYALIPCGHASLCKECCPKVDVCPICRCRLPRTGDKLRLRLYHECVEAGLISPDHEDEHQLLLYLVTRSLLFMLDEVVVKDWVKRTFRNILSVLREIYSLETKGMQAWLDSLLKYSKQVAGIFSVLEVMESAFKGSVSPQLQEVQKLRENIGKTKQHLDIMIWCIRHGFLEDVRSRYSTFTSWKALVLERKSDAIKRAWPDAVDQSSDCNVQGASLFIEDALQNLEREPEYSQDIGADLDVGCLQNDERSILRSKIEGISGSYPFESLRTAADILFLQGSSDLVVAKQAIHWTAPEKYWKHIIDDFAATFGVSRHSLLESFVFYLLDDPSSLRGGTPVVAFQILYQEACRTLPEICGPETYPKNWFQLVKLPASDDPSSDEEKYLHRCLLDSASDDPSSAVGSLLVVFYLQRYRYIQAYQVDLKLQSIAETFVSENRIGEEVMSRMRSQSHWRKELVDEAIDILPAIQQQQVRSGQFSEVEDTSEAARNSDLPDAQQPEMISS
ncbi:hypothetical protein F2Q68_00001708 [Brassica cretica]|nr:hypothetical protein F2Q68_00001708 [Brassica cretica]